VDGVPVHAYVEAFHMHPMFRHATWYEDRPLQYEHARDVPEQLVVPTEHPWQ
jgi:hypothetical protein